MLFKRVNRTDAEQVFIVVKNASTETIKAGYSCVFSLTAADGVSVTKAGSNTLGLFAGVAAADIPPNTYGLVQVYGYCDAAAIYVDSVTKLEPGETLGPKDGSWGLVTYGASQGSRKAHGYSLDSANYASQPSLVFKKIFIKGL